MILQQDPNEHYNQTSKKLCYFVHDTQYNLIYNQKNTLYKSIQDGRSTESPTTKQRKMGIGWPPKKTHSTMAHASAESAAGKGEAFLHSDTLDKVCVESAWPVRHKRRNLRQPCGDWKHQNESREPLHSDVTVLQQAVHEGHQVVYIYYSGKIGAT